MSARAPTPIRRISVVVPMLNEAHRIEGLVDDLAAQDFAGELEIFVADGCSTDGSAELLAAAAERAALEVTLIENPGRSVAPGLNACIERTTGDLIVRLDCKARYPSDYLRRCARAAEETGAWNVGGVLVPVGLTPTERAVACAMDSAFGGIGWTRHGRSGDRVETDTVYCGAFRPEAFERIGLFVDWAPNHDDELNLRLRLAGGRIVLDPAIHAYYTPRGSFRDVFGQYHDYGFWKPPVMLHHGSVLSARSLVPSAFVVSLAVLAAPARRSPTARRLLGAELAGYAGCALAFAAASVRRRREPWGLVARTAAVFPTFHVAYGVGMLHGVVRAVGAALTGKGEPPGASRSRSGRKRARRSA